MKSGISQIIGRTISSVAVIQNNHAPSNQVFLVFTDGTYYEFWGNEFSCAGGIDQGGMEAALDYATTVMRAESIRVYP